MLLNLHIKNMALIDEIDIDFGDGLNILTGETGAGKSIVIGSIMLALGGKAPKDFVRKDAEYGLVELLFSIEDGEVMEKLSEWEIPDADSGELILSRKIIGGRSVSKMNGETVTISRVREAAALLLDLHAQHEHQSLLVPGNHIRLLDRFGGEELIKLKSEVKELYEQYRLLEEEYQKNSINEEEKKRQLDLMEYESREIEEAALKEGEDEQVEQQYRLAANSKSIAEHVGSAYTYVEETAYAAVDRSVREMSAVTSYDEHLGSLSETLDQASELLSDFVRSARAYLEENTFSDEEFRELENRLDTINHLKAKYGKTIPEVLAYGERIRERYDQLVNHEAYMMELGKRRDKQKAELLQACESLSACRKKVAAELAGRIRTALVDLNFLDVRFDMVFERLEEPTASGFDHAYFIISTNVGEDMKPLWQVASGGELSRIMLAMKSCLADADRIETLIFDEIDVGISGRTAQMVAEKINGIGRNHQVICITHLPQIAAMANHHYLIEKKVTDGKTVTQIYALEPEQEIRELARLIGGVEITDRVMESAREMKELAEKAKVN